MSRSTRALGARSVAASAALLVLVAAASTSILRTGRVI